MKEKLHTVVNVNEEGDVIPENDGEVGLFDDMSFEEQEVAIERIGGALFEERYKEYSDENKNIFRDVENGIFSRISELTEIHPRIARCIAENVRVISLPHIQILYEDVAVYLGYHTGSLYLSGLRTLEYGVAKKLSKHNGFIDLCLLESLSDFDAEAFIAHSGELRLEGLQSVSEKGLRALAQHNDRVYLPEAYQKKWEEYKKEVYPIRKAV
jgi:hypothetical protein